jgi:hypothetical protein
VIECGLAHRAQAGAARFRRDRACIDHHEIIRAGGRRVIAHRLGLGRVQPAA